MAKCNRGGKSGFFFRVESSGSCKECDRIVKLEVEESRLSLRIQDLSTKINLAQVNLNEITERSEKIYQEISETAKRDALREISGRIAELETNYIAAVKKSEDKYQEINKLMTEENKLQKSISLAGNKLKRVQTLFKAHQYTVSRFQNNDGLSKEILHSTAGNEVDELLETTVKLKFHLMDIRELKRAFQQNEKIIKDLLTTYQSRYSTKANATIYRLMVIALEAELQNVLYNLSYSKLDGAIKDIKTITAKYQKIATDGNQSIAPTIAKFIGEIEYLFIEAIKIEHEYYIQRERIKDEQRMLRAQIRQEAAERKILEEQRKKIEQEEAKYKSELSQIAELIAQTSDQERIQQLQERVERVQGQLNEIEGEKDKIITLQNGKAGYIYIISSLGSFGENVFKVGMTRRLDPQDRVNELGDASVPFSFDVHSFIFSNSAPELERALHKRLHNKRINKVNLRKEFFNCTISELEELVYELEPTAAFNSTMLAEHYFQSMTIDFIPESVRTEFDDESEELDEELS